MNLKYIVAIVALCLAGCKSYDYADYMEITDNLQVLSCGEAINERYPQKFKMTQRVVLNIGGKQYDFNGYLLVDRDKGFRGAGFSDIGGKVFDVSAKGNDFKALLKPDGMPLNPITKGMMKDIEHLYMNIPYERRILTEHEDGTRDFIEFRADSNYDVFRLNKNDNLPALSMTVRDGKIIREVVYKNYQKFKGIKMPVPASLILTNNDWNYQIEINQSPSVAIPAAALAKPTENPK